MKLYKIRALVYLDFALFRNAKWRLSEFLYFPVTTVILWGLFANFVKGSALEAGLIVLMMNILWTFAYLAQSTVNMQMNEDSWSGSLRQILVTGISEFEYLAARLFSSAFISVLVMALMLVMAYYGFGLSIIAANFADIVTLSALTLLGSLALAIFVASIIFFAGAEYAFLGWTAMQIFMLLSAPFYPVSSFPEPFQTVAWVMPFTAIFEVTRGIIGTGFVNQALLSTGAATVFLYFVLSLPIYYLVFRYAKKSGRLVRIA